MVDVVTEMVDDSAAADEAVGTTVVVIAMAVTQTAIATEAVASRAVIEMAAARASHLNLAPVDATDAQVASTSHLPMPMLRLLLQSRAVVQRVRVQGCQV